MQINRDRLNTEIDIQTTYVQFYPFEPDNEYFENFKWAVPVAFSSPLNNCRFGQGDIFYNTNKAYLSPWSEALKYIEYGIQVTFPPRAVASETNEDSDAIFESNWRSPLEFDLLIFEEHKITNKKHIKTTQGALYSFLWNGYFSIFETHNSPSPPKRLKFFKEYLDSNFFHLTVFGSKFEYSEVFFMPFDKTNPVSRNKLTALKKKLSEEKYSSIINLLFSKTQPDNAEKLAPTLQVVAVLSKPETESILNNIIKDLFYKTTQDKKSAVDKFKISNHGILLKKKS